MLYACVDMPELSCATRWKALKEVALVRKSTNDRRIECAEKYMKTDLILVLDIRL